MRYEIGPETREALSSVEDNALVVEVSTEICNALRGKGFSPVQAEAVLELAKSKLMQNGKLV